MSLDASDEVLDAVFDAGAALAGVTSELIVLLASKGVLTTDEAKEVVMSGFAGVALDEPNCLRRWVADIVRNKVATQLGIEETPGDPFFMPLLPVIAKP